MRWNIDIGAKIKELRSDKGFTRYRLSELSGVSQTHISDIERGVKVPTIETISKLLEPLEVSLGEFFAKNDRLYDLNQNEQKAIALFRKLPKGSEDVVIQLLELLSKSTEGKNKK